MSKLTSRIPTLLLLSLSTIVANAQDNQPPPRIQLKDPTPRPDDLQRKYENSNSALDMSEHAVAVRRAQNWEQVQRAADMLVLLAQRLRDSTSTKSPATPASVQRASEIEVLAKIVRERMKLP